MEPSFSTCPLLPPSKTYCVVYNWKHKSSIFESVALKQQPDSYQLSTTVSICRPFGLFALLSSPIRPCHPTSVLVLFICRHLLPRLLSFSTSSSLSPSVTSELTLTFSSFFSRVFFFFFSGHRHIVLCSWVGMLNLYKPASRLKHKGNGT